MGLCPDCYLPKGSPEEAVSSPETPWCECPFIKNDDYTYNEDEDPDEYPDSEEDDEE